jgi:imidazolonepropionase
VAIALASDANPGTSPLFSHLVLLNLACVLFRLTPEEALLSVTKHAAKALHLSKSKGMIAKGMDADFIIWQAQHPAEIIYQFGLQPLLQLVKQGELIQI